MSIHYSIMESKHSPGMYKIVKHGTLTSLIFGYENTGLPLYENYYQAAEAISILERR